MVKAIVEHVRGRTRLEKIVLIDLNQSMVNGFQKALRRMIISV